MSYDISIEVFSTTRFVKWINVILIYNWLFPSILLEPLLRRDKQKNWMG